MDFEDGDGFSVSAVMGETVTKVRGRVALSVDRQEGGDGEVDSGGRPERLGGNANVEEVRQLWRGEVMDGFHCLEEDVVVVVAV